MPPGDQKHVRDTCRDDSLFSFWLWWMFAGWRTSTLWGHVGTRNHPQALSGRAQLCPVGPPWRWGELAVHAGVVSMSLCSGHLCDLGDFPKFPEPQCPSLYIVSTFIGF